MQSYQRTPLGIITESQGKFSAALEGISGDSFEVVQIVDEQPEIQAEPSHVARFAALNAVRKHGFAMIREDHSIYFNGIAGLPGPYASYAEEQMGVDGLLEVLHGKDRTGS